MTIGDKKMKQRIVALAIGGIVGLIVGRLLSPFLADILVDIWYWLFDRPKIYLLARNTLLAAAWLLLVLLGAVSGYRLSRRIPLRRIIGIALGVIVGVSVGALLAPFLAAWLEVFVWYRFFDRPIYTSQVGNPLFVAIALLLIFLGALLGYLVSSLLGKFLSLLPKRNKVEE